MFLQINGNLFIRVTQQKENKILNLRTTFLKWENINKKKIRKIRNFLFARYIFFEIRKIFLGTVHYLYPGLVPKRYGLGNHVSD
jgi:hypothetical protein